MTNKTLAECIETLQKVDTLLQLILVAEDGLTVLELAEKCDQEAPLIRKLLNVMLMRGWCVIP